MVSRFEKIIIRGLFGSDKDVEIDFDKKDPVRILYGLNSSGKTTVMKIIQHSYCWNPIELQKLPFKSITYSLNKRGELYAESYLIGNKGDNGNTYFPTKVEESLDPEVALVKILTSLDEILDHIESITEQIHNKREKYNNSRFDNNLDRESERQGISNLHSQLKIKKSEIESSEHEVNYWLHKLMELKPIPKQKYDRDNDYEFDSYEWDDCVEIFDDEQNIDIRIRSEFDHSIQLTVEKIMDNPEQIYFPQFQGFRTQNVGRYFKIIRKSEPIITFTNNAIKHLLDTWNRIHLMQVKYLLKGWKGWNFDFRTEEEELIRMPDVYDLWESDWERIESRLTDYSIARNYSGDGSFKPDIGEHITIIENTTQMKIDVEDFLTFHLPGDFFLHAKKDIRQSQDGIRTVIGGNYRNFSPSMKTPDLISTFFEYRKTKLAEFNWNNESKFYVLQPKILNISTDRKNDDIYFYKFCREFNRRYSAHRDVISNITSVLEKPKLAITTGFQPRTSIFGYQKNEPFKILKNLLSSNFDIGYDSFSSNKEWRSEYNKIQQFLESAKITSEPTINQLGIDYNLTEQEMDGTQFVTIHEICEWFNSIVKKSELENLIDYINSSFEGISYDIEKSKIFENGKELRFSQLSSGIRQRFRIFTSVGMQVTAASKSVILIDEPEISLHLSWQRSFVDDITTFLKTLVSDARVRFDEEENLESVISIIISTHSPAVLANHFHRGQKIGESDISDD